MSLERTKKLIKGLHDNLARTPMGNDREQVRGILEKRCDLALVNSYYMGIMLSNPKQRHWGESARVFFPDQKIGGSIILRSGLALTRAERNTEMATSLMEHLVQKETQNKMAQITFAYPVIGGLLFPKINRKLGEDQPGIKDGVFKFRMVPLAAIIRNRASVIEFLDTVNFDVVN
jgi:iron(III) transport system substrate-binding protein